MLYDAVIVGGGFYGCCIAYGLASTKMKSVLLVEQEGDLLQRASAINQARVHMGYHYPRNLKTALRSCFNFGKFVVAFKPAIVSDFKKLYAIARNDSKVNAYTFYNTFKSMRAPIKEATSQDKKLFNPNMIEDVYEVKEYAFDHAILKDILKNKLTQYGVEVRYNSSVSNVCRVGSEVVVELAGGECVRAQHVFNATYSGTNLLLKKSGLPLLPFKHEVTELCLVQVPEELHKMGVTVMDGPFFSVMPYPTKGMHSLTHVRYTPHGSWKDADGVRDTKEVLENDIRKNISSNYMYMLKSAMRYMPILQKCKYVESLYEIKTVLLSNEKDDGRPILFRKDFGIEGLHVVMGGKLDNVFDLMDIFEELRIIKR